MAPRTTAAATANSTLGLRVEALRTQLDAAEAAAHTARTEATVAQEKANTASAECARIREVLGTLVFGPGFSSY